MTLDNYHDLLLHKRKEYLNLDLLILRESEIRFFVSKTRTNDIYAFLTILKYDITINKEALAFLKRYNLLFQNRFF